MVKDFQNYNRRSTVRRMLKVYSNQTLDVNKICQRVVRFNIVEATFAFDLVAFDLVAFYLWNNSCKQFIIFCSSEKYGGFVGKLCMFFAESA